MSSYKLLLADDSVTIRKVVELTFADEGVAVSAVADGQEAMRKFVEVQPDMVIVDVNMPAPNGYQICEMIKADPETQHIPVLLLVGSFEPFDQTEAERVGADGFMTKPFQTIRELVDKVNELLSSNSPSSSAHPETEDIDNLYKRSFEETLKMPHTKQAESNFGGPGMDDDLIETVRPQAEDDLINASYLSDEDQNDPIDLFKSSIPATVQETPVQIENINDSAFKPKYPADARAAEDAVYSKNDPNETTKLEWPGAFGETAGVDIGIRTQEIDPQPVSALTGKPEVRTEPLEWPVESSGEPSSNNQAAWETVAEPEPNTGSESDLQSDNIIEWPSTESNTAGESNTAPDTGHTSDNTGAESDARPRDTLSAYPDDNAENSNAIPDANSYSESSVADLDILDVGGTSEKGSAADWQAVPPEAEPLQPSFTEALTESPGENQLANWPEPAVGEENRPAENNAESTERSASFEPRFVFDEPELLEISDQRREASVPKEAETVPSGTPATEMQKPTPEFIDAVARMVVEKLSVDVIREIAREAVPRIAENLIREALEDEGSN